MTRSQRMQPVRKLAEDKATAAAKACAEAQRKVDEQSTRLTQLINYREDYRNQRTATGGQGIDAFRLRDYNAFMGRIDQAIEQQRQALLRCEQELEQRRKQWMGELGRARALDKVVDRYTEEERREIERKLQGQADELAQRRR